MSETRDVEGLLEEIERMVDGDYREEAEEGIEFTVCTACGGSPAHHYEDPPCPTGMLEEAAATIRTLRAELERTNAALREGLSPIIRLTAELVRMPAIEDFDPGGLLRRNAVVRRATAIADAVRSARRALAPVAEQTGETRTDAERRQVVGWLIQPLDNDGTVMEGLLHFPKFVEARHGRPQHGEGFRITALAPLATTEPEETRHE